MSLTKEIKKVHNELYKLSNKNVDVLLPITLTLLDIYKSKLQSGSEDPINETLADFKKISKKNIGETLLRINSEHSEISPLLIDTIQHHLNELGPQQESRINQIIRSISENKEFIAGLREKDFVGTLYETMVASEFDKQDGRFFTPKNIILINVEIMKTLLETRNEDLSSLSICDPCCGSGRFLIYWVESIIRFYEDHSTSEEIDETIQKIYHKYLYGIDIGDNVAGYACWNMLFHGDGATNIANADSLNHYGILVHWKLIESFVNDFENKFDETKDKIIRREIQEKLKFVETLNDSVLSFKGKNEVDIASSELFDLIDVINALLEIHSEVPLDWWPIIQELHSLKDFDSVNEIMKFKWNNVNEDISSGFDVIITNPPFGRGENLQIEDPKILCQYKLATEAWIGDLTKDNLIKLIKKQFNDNLTDFYLDIFMELGIEKVVSEYKIDFSELLMPKLKEFAELKGILIERKKKSDIIDDIINFLDRDHVSEVDAIKIDSLSQAGIKKVVNNVLFEDEGKVLGNYLKDKIVEKLGQEWVKIDDVFDYEYKIGLKDSLTGYKHAIYYDIEGNPLLFKDQLPKQVLFIEQFLRMVKDGGKIFTVIDTGVLSNIDDEYVRRFLFKNSIVYNVIEFPHNAFKAAGTGVKTAIVLYEKASNPSDDYKIFGSLPQNLGYVLNKQDTPADPDNNDLGKTLCDYREYMGLGKMCDKNEEDCDWTKNGFCKIWREKIEKVED